MLASCIGFNQLTCAIVTQKWYVLFAFYFELRVCSRLYWNINFTDVSWRECRTKSYNKDSQ